MGVLTDIFTDPPELVAAMQVKPGEPLKRTIGEAERIGPEHFIEQVDIDHAPRHGMAPPRQRPRRVAKKLAARGFAAHVGGRVFTAAQVRSTKHSAPALARWLDMPGLPTAGLTVDLGAVQVGAAGLAPVEPSLAAEPSIQVYSFTPPTLGPIASGSGPMLQRATLVAMNYGVDYAIYKRHVWCMIRVFSQDEEAASAIVGPIIQRIAKQLAHDIVRAAHGWTDTKVVSRQTSCRPIKRTRTEKARQ